MKRKWKCSECGDDIVSPLEFIEIGQQKDFVEARSIVRWLSKQKNSEVGFITSQGSVVALQVSISVRIFKNLI